MSPVTRFAPSPTGPLHLGHAFAAMVAHDLARAEGGRFLLRIEDIDPTRCRPEWERAIDDDLAWLGLVPDAPPMRQSARMGAYHAALDTLWGRGLLYPCDCTRADISAALSAPQEGAVPAVGPDGPVYPGTCRPPEGKPRNPGERPRDRHLRLDMARACETLGKAIAGRGLHFRETSPAHQGQIAASREDYVRGIGDVVLARRDMGTSYHLSVVVDDAAQGITLVTRGEDLLPATAIHVLLQRLLALPTPDYHHHRLIRDDEGKRLAKRDDARAIARYRTEGATVAEIRRMVGL